MQRTFSISKKLDRTVTRVLLGLNVIGLLNSINLIVRGGDWSWISIVFNVVGVALLLRVIVYEEK